MHQSWSIWIFWYYVLVNQLFLYVYLVLLSALMPAPLQKCPPSFVLSIKKYAQKWRKWHPVRAGCLWRHEMVEAAPLAYKLIMCFGIIVTGYKTLQTYGDFFQSISSLIKNIYSCKLHRVMCYLNCIHIVDFVWFMFLFAYVFWHNLIIYIYIYIISLHGLKKGTKSTHLHFTIPLFSKITSIWRLYNFYSIHVNVLLSEIINQYKIHLFITYLYILLFIFQ